MRRPVGIDQSVAEEVSVRRPVGAEVASVGPIAVACSRILDQQPLVDPVPDEAPLKVGRAVDRLPHIPEPACRVPHRMGILRCDVRPVGLRPPPLSKSRRRGILRTEDVRVPLQQRPFVLHRTKRVHPLEPQVGLVEVIAVPGLVPQAPEHHAREVLGLVVHVLRPIHVFREPQRIIAQGLSLRQVVSHPVRLDVGLVAEVEAVLVGQLVEPPLLRVVAQTYRIDIIGLHQPEVFADRRLVEHVAVFLVVLVVVDPLDVDRPTVHIVFVPLDLAGTEPDPRAGILHESPVVPDLQHEVIEVRILCAPPEPSSSIS